MCWSLSRSMPCSIVSKAAERSKSVRRESLPESRARRMSFVILRRACFSAMVRAVSGLRRTDKLVFSEIG